jgi:hypothetical protein
MPIFNHESPILDGESVSARVADVGAVGSGAARMPRAGIPSYFPVLHCLQPVELSASVVLVKHFAE